MLNAITWLWRWLIGSYSRTTTTATGAATIIDHGTDPQPPWPPN
jgi:hypothetical protein